MILIGYDGSDDARSAVEHAGELLDGQQATVLTVWEPFIEMLARSGSGYALVGGLADVSKIDEANRRNAEKVAEEGAELAGKVGLDAQPRTCSQETTTALAILSEAKAVEARAIVMGSRGLTGVKSLLLGSVSHAVIQHADRAVIVVPSPRIAAERGHEREGEA